MYKAPVVASQSVSTFDSPFVDGQLRGSPSQAHYHSKWRRTAELFFELGWRWLRVATVCSLLVLTLMWYNKRVAVDRDSVRTYNSIITGLSIILSLSTEAFLRDVANKWRWYFLSRRYWSAKEFSLIIRSAERMEVLRLGWYAFQKSQPGMIAMCVMWLIFGIAAQVAVAAFGLTFEVANPADFNLSTVLTTYGNATVLNLADLSLYNFNMSANDSMISALGSGVPYGNDEDAIRLNEQDAAHTFGMLTSSYPVQNVSASAIPQDTAALYYTQPVPGRPATSWVFNFTDFSSNPSTYLIPEKAMSSRQARVTWSCQPLEVWFLSWDYQVANFGFYDQNLGFNKTITIDASAMGNTTSHIAYNNETFAKEPRMTRVFTLWTSVTNTMPSTVQDQWLVVCNITVAPIVFGDHKEYIAQAGMNLSDQNARVLAGAIAWNPGSAFQQNAQAQTYPRTSPWAFGVPSLIDANTTGWLFAGRFAIGAIAGWESGGSYVNAENVLAFVDSQVVSPKWKYVWAAMIPLTSTLLGISLVSIFWLRHVVAPGDGPFVMTQLLKGALMQGSRTSMTEETAVGQVRGSLVYSWKVVKEEGAGAEMWSMPAGMPTHYGGYTSLNGGYSEEGEEMQSLRAKAGGKRTMKLVVGSKGMVDVHRSFPSGWYE